MGKKLKSLSLVLFSICCTIGFGMSASALTMEKDMKASDITIEDGMVIDGAGKFTITGGLNISDAKDITIKNVTLDGEGTKDILLSLSNAGKVVIENVTFKNYTKAGIYGEYMESISVTKSTFDASGTKNIGDGDYSGNPEEDLIKRSAAGIDLNLGNGAKYDVNVSSIKIVGNTFKNVVATQENSTAGAIKVKVKDASRLKNIGTVTIADNTFLDNDKDLVVGTNSPTAGTEQSATGDLEILLDSNTSMKVTNNSAQESTTETLTGNYKLNYADNKKYELDEDLYYIVNEDNFDDLENITSAVLGDDDVKGIAISVDGISFAISKENIDENLGEAIDKFDIVPSEETAIEALKKYQGEGVFFVEVTGLDSFKDGISFNTTLDEEFDGRLFVYYYDEENGLQLVSNPNADKGKVEFTFAKNGHYVVSEKDLLASTPSEEVPTEPTPEEVPQTFDALGVYAIGGALSVAAIVGAVVYLKRRSA